MNSKGELELYVGTYTETIRFGTGAYLHGKGQGIYRCRLEPESGKMSLQGLAAETINPSYLAVSRTRNLVFAVNELKEYEGKATGTVSSFRRNPETGKLSLINSRISGGTDPCHVCFAEEQRKVFVANFMSGSVSSYRLGEDGTLLGPAANIRQHGFSIDPKRQNGPHAHASVYDDRLHLLYVPDLGLDQVLVYKVDTKSGDLQVRTDLALSVLPGAGPRQLEIHGNGKFAYLVNELNSTVVACSISREDGGLRIMETHSILPPDYSGSSTAADLHISPCGMFLYCSNRGHDSIAVFRIDVKSGGLTLVGITSSGGQTPRNFALDPTGKILVAAHQDSDTLVSFFIDQDTGELHPTGQSLSVQTPVCVKFF